MRMNKRKKTIIAAVSVFLCLCLTCVSAVLLRKNRKNLTAKTPGQSKTTVNNSALSSSAEPSAETKPETTSKKETTTQEKTTQTVNIPNSTEVNFDKPTTANPKTTVPKTTEPKSTKPYKPATDYTYYPARKIPGALAKKAAVPGSWFDDAVFVGDSVSLKLNMYESSVNRLGKARFLTAGSLSATNALWDVSDKSVHPKYNGKKQKVEDSIAQMKGVKKVYIMLGMNDINAVGRKNGIKNFEKLCNRILEKSPNVKIYVQSVTPLIKGSKSSVNQEGKLNNKTIYEYNKMLAALAKKRGWYFVNVSEVMYDKNGYLKLDYCGDQSSMGLHFTNAGCKAWIDYLLTHTP